MLLRYIPLLLILLLFARPALAAGIPGITDSELAAALELAGQNRAQLEQALDGCVQQPYATAALRFLIANLPAVDLGCITGEELSQHVTLAMQARGEFAYGRDYDDATWAHYVLAPRVSQEPLTAWRPYFYNELRGQVKDCRTIGQAAVIAGAWCGAHATYKPTQSRDQSPLATLKSGYGRCEELVILFIDACRAIGVPARQAYVPYWSNCDDNHAWWEVWGSDGKWHLEGQYGPDEDRDSVWFADRAKEAALVVSVCFGLPGAVEERDGVLYSDTGEEVLNLKREAGARYCTLNSMRDYRPVQHLRVIAPPGAGGINPATLKPYRLCVYVFNYGALRSVARVDFRPQGLAALALGAGDYVISTDLPQGPQATLMHLATGRDATLIWDECPPLPPAAVLRYPRDPAD
jgi:hypothetical protein